MKRTLPFLTAMLLCMAACRPAEDRLRSGDLIFVGLPAEASADGGGMGAAIAAATGTGALHYIHVAIAEVQADSVFVIDATLARGVARRPLSVFLADFTRRDGSLPQFTVKRLRRKAPDAVENAKAFCGLPYDTLFLPKNDALYCSELVRESFRAADGRYLFEEAPMNWKDADGKIPAYWEQLFGRMGMEVPQGVPGTNPQAMAASAVLRDVAVRLVPEP